MGPRPSRSASRNEVSRSSTATRARPKTMVWRPARRKARAARYESPWGPGRTPVRGIQRRRVQDHDVALPLGRAAAVDDVEGPPGQGLGELARVADGRRAEDDAWRRAVVGTDAQQPAQDVGDVAAEDAPVGVRLVDDDEAKLLEELEPLRVVRQDGRAEHVRVGDHDLAGLADDGPDGCRGVAVVDGRREVHVRQRGEVAELRQLVLAEGLGGEQVERAGCRVLGDGLQDRQVVAERLARCGGRHDGHVPARAQRLQRLRLVAVQGADAASLQGLHEAIVQPVGHGDLHRLLRGQDLVACQAAGDSRLGQKGLEGLQRGTRLVEPHGRLQKWTRRSICAEV